MYIKCKSNAFGNNMDSFNTCGFVNFWGNLVETTDQMGRYRKMEEIYSDLIPKQVVFHVSDVSPKTITFVKNNLVTMMNFVGPSVLKLSLYKIFAKCSSKLSESFLNFVFANIPPSVDYLDVSECLSYTNAYNQIPSFIPNIKTFYDGPFILNRSGLVWIEILSSKSIHVFCSRLIVSKVSQPRVTIHGPHLLSLDMDCGNSDASFDLPVVISMNLKARDCGELCIPKTTQYLSFEGSLESFRGLESVKHLTLNIENLDESKFEQSLKMACPNIRTFNSRKITFPWMTSFVMVCAETFDGWKIQNVSAESWHMRQNHDRTIFVTDSETAQNLGQFVITPTSYQDAVDQLERLEFDRVFVVGKKEIYDMFVDVCDEIHITTFTSFEDGEDFTYDLSNFALSLFSEQVGQDGILYTYRSYSRV
jgi:dihydrofolate reductase